MDMQDFIKNARFHAGGLHGIVAQYEGREYDVLPDGDDYVRVVGSHGETLGRMTFNNGQFVEAT